MRCDAHESVFDASGVYLQQEKGRTWLDAMRPKGGCYGRPQPRTADAAAPENAVATRPVVTPWSSSTSAAAFVVDRK
jgi:hypothetical protein